MNFSAGQAWPLAYSYFYFNGWPGLANGGWNKRRVAKGKSTCREMSM